MTAHEKTDKLIRELERMITRAYSAEISTITDILNMYLQPLHTKMVDLVKKRINDEITDQQFRNGIVILITADRGYKYMIESITEAVADTSEAVYEMFADYEEKVSRISFEEEREEVKQDYNGMSAMLAALSVAPLIDAKMKLNRKKELKYVEWNIKTLITSNALTYSAKTAPTLSASLHIHPRYARYGYTLDQEILSSVKTFTDDLSKGTVKETLKRSARASKASARTRMTKAENRAKQMVFDVLHKFGVDGMKVWHTQMDERVREDHTKMEGVAVPFDQPFNVGGYEMMFPCDESGGAPPSQIYNCRCYMKRERKNKEVKQ